MKVQSLFSMPNFQPTAALFSSALFTVPLKISQWQLWQRMFYISQGYILFLTWKRTENSKARQNLTIEDAKFFFFCNIYLLYSKKNFEYITLHYFTCSIRCTFSKIKKKTWLASPVTFPSKKLNLISKDWQRHNFNYISQFATGKEVKVLISPQLRTAKNCKKH